MHVPGAPRIAGFGLTAFLLTTVLSFAAQVAGGYSVSSAESPVLLGLVCAILIAGAGFAGLRLLGIARDSVGLGLAPALGIALLAVLSSWGLQVGLPEVGAGLVILAVCLAGLAFAVREGIVSIQAYCVRDWATPALLLASLLVPIIVLGQAFFIQAGVPDFAFDGPHHVEMIEALRHGARLAGLAWYPTGFHAPAAALLSLVPALDSASGVVDWAVGLTLLAPLGVFGLGTAIWRDVRVGAAGALLLALTLDYPYGAHLYSQWPMAAGLLLVVGLWTTTIKYLENPSPRLATVGALLAGGLLLTHGTEVYTAAIGLLALAAARWKHVLCWKVGAQVGLAPVVAVALAVPYLPQLVGWTSTGGAVTAGADYFDVRRAALPNNAVVEVVFWAEAFSSGLLLDLPARLALLGVGAWLTFSQRTSRLLVLLALLFAALVATFRYIDAAPVRAVFAFTLPWGVDDRLVMTVPLLTAPLGGAGLVWIGRALARRSQQSGAGGITTDLKWRRRARLALTFGLASGLASVFVVAATFGIQTSLLVTYSADDSAAMTWLNQRAQTGEVLMNDGAADAGIWAPYKAKVSIVMPHTQVFALGGPELLLRANLGQLDTQADVRRAACTLNVRYIYRGAAPSPEARQFPGLDELRQVAALEEIFRSGEASIFRTRLDCPG